MDADVFVVPEMSGNIKLPSHYAMFWVGSNRNKGLGVIYNRRYNCRIAEWYNSVHEYSLPILCDDLCILAAWPTKTSNNKGKSYPQIAMEIIKDYMPYITDKKVLICGDFNCYVGQSGENRSKYSIKLIVDLLNRNNIYSLYHSIYNESLGRETRATFYFRFNVLSPFFIDYAFSNFAVKSFEIAEWDKSMSDHCALITQF